MSQAAWRGRFEEGEVASVTPSSLTGDSEEEVVRDAAIAVTQELFLDVYAYGMAFLPVGFQAGGATGTVVPSRVQGGVPTTALPPTLVPSCAFATGLTVTCVEGRGYCKCATDGFLAF